MPADLVPIDSRDPAIAPARARPDTDPDDPRVGHLLGTHPEPLVVLVGFPTDQGVSRNHGRPGAADGPREIRRWLYRMTPDAERCEESRSLLARTADLGDVAITGDLEEDQERLGRVVAAQLSSGRLPVVLGGGHEVTYGHFLGHFLGRVESRRPLELLNWDAHPDVRETVDGKGSSGTSFRQALEHPSALCRRYRVFGLQRQSVAAAHLAWLRDQGGEAHFADEVDAQTVRDAYLGCALDCLVSFDLDAVDSAFAPGVSAPCTGGLSTATWLAAAEEAGACPHVRSIDVAELNPKLDLDGRTARLGALTVWRFFRGLARRVGQGSIGAVA